MRKRFRAPDQVVHDFQVIGEPLTTLLAAIGNKLDREFPTARAEHPGSRTVVLGLYRSGENMFSAIRAILADEPGNSGRHLKLAPACAPLTRSLVDCFCALVFLFDKLPARTTWFYRGGYRDAALELASLKATRGGDPEWAEMIQRLEDHLLKVREPYGVSEAEAAAPKTILKWPNPGGMKTYPGLSADRREFLAYFYDWQYRVLSQDAHMNLIGVIRRIPLMDRDSDIADRERRLEQIRSMHFLAALATMMCIATEIELECKFGLLDRARYVWAVTSEWEPTIKELYERFYLATFKRLGIA